MEPRPSQKVDFPPTYANGSPRDFLFSMLQRVAQIEHELMVQYLFAAYSLGGDETMGHPDFVRDCRDTLLAVAREEMGHLLTVQNILVLVGGPISLERWPASSLPAACEFRLEPFSFGSLAKYLDVEAPGEFDRALLKDGLSDRTNDTKAGSNQIGWIYEWLGDALQNRDVIPDSTFNPETYRYQASWDELARGYGPHNARPYALHSDAAGEQRGVVIVSPVTTRNQVVSAIREITGQGEGPKDGNQYPGLSHFDRFNRLFERFDSIRQKEKNKQWSPSRRVATNPWVDKLDNSPSDITEIPQGTARFWAQLFNLRYRILLSFLTYLFRVPRDGRSSVGAARSQIISRLFGEMYNLKAVAGILVRLPINDKEPDGERAGPPFQLPYTLTPPGSKLDFWRMHLDLLQQAENLAEVLLSGEYVRRAPPEGASYLRFMHDADQQAGRWVEMVLANEALLP